MCIAAEDVALRSSNNIINRLGKPICNWRTDRRTNCFDLRLSSVSLKKGIKERDNHVNGNAVQNRVTDCKQNRGGKVLPKRFYVS